MLLAFLWIPFSLSPQQIGPRPGPAPRAPSAASLGYPEELELPSGDRRVAHLVQFGKPHLCYSLTHPLAAALALPVLPRHRYSTLARLVLGVLVVTWRDSTLGEMDSTPGEMGLRVVRAANKVQPVISHQVANYGMGGQYEPHFDFSRVRP